MNVETLELIIDESVSGTQAYRDEVLKIDKSSKTYVQWEIAHKYDNGAHLWKKGLHYIYSHKGRCKLLKENSNPFI
jgi:hypothetical protein